MRLFCAWAHSPAQQKQIIPFTAPETPKNCTLAGQYPTKGHKLWHDPPSELITGPCNDPPDNWGCHLSSEFVIFYSTLWFLWSLKYCTHPPFLSDSMCAEAKTPPSHYQAIVYLWSHTRGRWSAGWRRVGRGRGRPHYQPAGQPRRATRTPPLHLITPVPWPAPSSRPNYCQNENGALLSGSF